MNDITRVASVIGLAKDGGPEYERLHREVWPAVIEQLRRVNVRNYSIFRDGDTLFSYFEYVGTDFDADMARMAADPATQEWWTLTRPLQVPRPGMAPGEWAPLRELMHLD